MKKRIYLLSVAVLGLLLTTWYSCETTPKETCEQDEICTEKFVTACCTDNACVYKFDGKEYTEDQIDQLAKDLGCATATTGLKSTQEDLEAVKESLRALMARVQEMCGTE